MAPPEEDLSDPQDVDVEIEYADETRAHVLFTVDGDHAAGSLPLVCDLRADADAELVVGSPVVLPDQTSLEAVEPRREGRRRAAQYVLKAKEACANGSEIHQVTTAGRSRAAILERMVGTYSISTLVTEDSPSTGVRSPLGFGGVDGVTLPDACDTIVVSRVGDARAVESILVPVATGPHSGLAAETGAALARQNDAELELLHVYSPEDGDGRAEGKEILAAASERTDAYEPTDRTLREAAEIPEAIIDHAQPFDVTVFGAPREGHLRQFVQGTVPDDVRAEIDGSVLVAYRGGGDDSWVSRWI